MSLINEALKRAKQETMRREAAQKGIPLPLIEQRRSTPWLAVAAAALGIALIASLTALFVVYSSPPTQAPPPASVPSLETPATEAAIPPPQVVAPEVSEEPATSSRAAESGPEAPPEETSPPISIPRLPEPVAAPEAIAATPTPSSIEPEATLSEAAGATYLQRAELDDGVTLELGGIAWSESGPIALVNGKAVGQGERVDGYLVVQIDPQQVEMRGTVGTLFIRLK